MKKLENHAAHFLHFYLKSMTTKRKQQKNERILAIDPGTREMGFVILQNHEILYYGVKTFRKRSPVSTLLKDVRKTILKLIVDFQPGTLVIEKTFFYKQKNTAKLIMMADEVKTIAKRKKLNVVEYAPKTVRKAICESGKATKRELAKILCSRYQELHVYLTQDRKWKEKYWQNMFDALGVGLTYQKEQESTPKK